jgi:hypothetical protein
MSVMEMHVAAEATRAAGLLAGARAALEAEQVDEAIRRMDEYNKMEIRSSPESVQFVEALEKQEGWPLRKVVELQEETRVASSMCPLPMRHMCVQREKPALAIEASKGQPPAIQA